MNDCSELARRCATAIGCEVTPSDVRGYLTLGGRALGHFSSSQRRVIAMTLAPRDIARDNSPAPRA